MERACGILLHITSLPSPFGIGTLGTQAKRFVDFLKEAGQSFWQVLPVGPTGFGDSPYQSFSAFAGNPYFIDLEALCEEGLLCEEELESTVWGEDPERVDFAKIYEGRFAVLRRAFSRGRFLNAAEFGTFCKEHTDWLRDYALFMALKNYFGGKPWIEWPDDAIRLREAEGIKRYSTLLSEDIAFYSYLQFLFFRQWKELKSYAGERGVRLIGDMPIYVSMDSADVWANPSLFWLDKERRPVCVAGCPPDYFSEKGQLWGNPLYNWEALKNTGYDWWVRRLSAALSFFDRVRIDHFRAFESYYAIPFPAADAVNGVWKKGPGMEFFCELNQRLGELPVIAEDLGIITPQVQKLLEDTGYPGMKVLQFAFDGNPENAYLPHNHIPDCVVYVGTHDNNTVSGWLYEVSDESLLQAKSYMAITGEEGWAWGFVRTAYASVSRLAVVQMQDLLELPGSCRMNTPSVAAENWCWRMKKEVLSQALAQKLRALAGLYGRLPEEEPQRCR